MYKITPCSSSASMRSPNHVELAPFKEGIKSDDPPQNVDISHLSNPTSTTTNLDETYPLDKSSDHLLHFDSLSLSSELEDTSSVNSVEIEFLPESDGKLDYTNQQMFSLDTMTMNCSYYKMRLMHQLSISMIRTLITVRV